MYTAWRPSNGAPARARGTSDEEDPMTEQSNQSDRPADEEGSPASGGTDTGLSGGGITEGESTVDEAMGGGDEPAR
jgi:hypothetical protein